MGFAMNRVLRSNRRKQRAVLSLRFNRRKLALLLLAFALATTADTCTDSNTGEPIPHEHTPAPAPDPTPKPDDPGSPPTCPPGQIPWGIFNEWIGCLDDPNTLNPEDSQPDDVDDTTSKPPPGTYTVDPGSTEDGEEILVERPPLCSTVTGDKPCIVSYHQDDDGNEVWVLPPSEGKNTEDNVNTVSCGALGDSLDHSSAPTPHVHPAPFPYDHDRNPRTPDICSHSSENCAWHGNCPGSQPINTPVVVQPLPTPAPKVCTSSWSGDIRDRVRSSLRWESIVPYDAGFTGYHHPEVPGGRLFLTAASTAVNPARHWTALRPGATLEVVDAPVDGCRWTATSVGVSLRELLPYQSSDLATLRYPGTVAAAHEAMDAADLWDRLSQERKQWYAAAFPRNDPAPNWCSPTDLPPWTTPTSGVLSLSQDWQDRYGRCRWSIPRRGFWEWQLQIRYTSELGDVHTEIAASDLSWFREPIGYLDQKVTLW